MRTLKDIYEAALIEIAKEGAPVFHLREFNHYVREAVNEVVDDLLMAFETGQKVLDYLKGIKRTVNINTFNPGAYLNSVSFDLPADYRHLTGLIVNYNVTSTIYDDCYEVGSVINKGSKRLDSDTYVSIINDPYQKDRYDRPYHITIGNRIELLTGVHPGITTSSVTLDYIKVPERLTLTQDQAFNETTDTSQVLEFDEITNRKILDKTTLKLLEKFGDPRIQSNPVIQQVNPPADVMPRQPQQG